MGGAFSLERIGGAPLDLRVRGQYYKFPQEDFFGIGADSSEDNRTNYLLESSEAGAELQWKPWQHIDLSGGMTYMRPKVGSGTDSRFQSTEQVFDPATIPGLAAQPDFLRSDAGVAFDWRDNPLHPHAGGRYGVELSDFRDQDLNAYSFRRMAIDLQQYVPVPNRYRTIALRAAAVLTDPRAGQRRAVLLPADARRRAAAARLPRVPLPGSQQPVADRRVPVGSVVGCSTARCSSTPARSPPTGAT